MQKESSLLGCLNQIKMSRRKAAPLYFAQKHCTMTNGAESNSSAPRHSGMFLSRIWARNNAFTLIELLVVVLIIGILAAVALPQYQKAVERARAMEGLSLLKSVGQAFSAHYLATGEWARSFDELAIDIPWTGNVKFTSTQTDVRSNGHWSLGIEHSQLGYVTLMAGRIDGKYSGGYFVMSFQSPTDAYEMPTIYCGERINQGSSFRFDTSLPAGAFCEKIVKGSFRAQGEWSRSYDLP